MPSQELDRDKLERIFKPHLAAQLRNAAPILFTGAGFSLGAANPQGSALPTIDNLKRMLWQICFPGDEFQAGSTLQDLYQHALQRNPQGLGGTLRRVLTVNSGSLPAWYERYFSFPWARMYTINIDDLDIAAGRRFRLARPIQAISALRHPGRIETVPGSLQSIHLNGQLQDAPQGVTFSTTQYAERSNLSDPFYAQLVGELVTRPVVFVGTTLSESPLWQHIMLRKFKGARGQRELRPRSYLVSPDLDRAKHALLESFNIEWLPMSAEEFSEVVLASLVEDAAKGLSYLASIVDRESIDAQLPLVSDFEVDLSEKSLFLLGAEPRWSDIHSGRAVKRSADQSLQSIVARLIAGDGGLVVVTGTAGTGKSTSLRHLAVALVAGGASVAWIDNEVDIAPIAIRTAMRAPDAARVLILDDADRYAAQLSPTVREILIEQNHPVVILALRSSRVDRVVRTSLFDGIDTHEHIVPPLCDNDIDLLIETLDRDNKLGALKGRPLDKQRAMFREKAGRQLLVAMIEATSGRRFEEKVSDELNDLDGAGRDVYATTSLATAFRYDIGREELVLAGDGDPNAMLNAVELLVSRGLVVRLSNGRLRSRHRVIAGIVVDNLQMTGLIKDVICRLILISGTRVLPGDSPGRRVRFLRSLMNHDFLGRVLGIEGARDVYAVAENTLSWNHHFWLQRGSLEVEEGDLALAENYLQQARSLVEHDPYVETEWSYLLFRRAIAEPAGMSAQTLADEAVVNLKTLIAARGDADFYPYHVLGSQGLAWCRRGLATKEAKKAFLEELLAAVKDGVERHPRAADLRKLRDDLQEEYLRLATRTPRTLYQRS